MANSHLRVSRSLAIGLVSAVATFAVLACSSPAPAPTPTAASKPAAAPAQPTTAPAQPTAAAAAATKPAAQPTTAAAPKSDFPNKPITYVVPWPAGGAMDLGARLLAASLETVLGQQVQVVNKAGATGQSGLTDFVKSAKPDGYTLVAINSPSLEPTYLDPERQAIYKRTSFAPVAGQVIDPNVYFVKTDSPYKTMADLVKAAKDKPEGIATSDTGLMSDDHISVLLFQQKTGIKLAMSHFEGSAPAQAAVLGGHVAMMIGNIGDAMSHYKSGNARVLGIAAAERHPMLPDVPTLKEQGIDLQTAVIRGTCAQAGTPVEIIKQLEAAHKKVDEMPAYREKMSNSGLPYRFMGTDEYDKFLQSEEKRIGELMPLLKQQ